MLSSFKGFTLIELLTVIAIISILSALVLPNYQAGQSHLALQRSANKLAQDIRMVQEMAMSAKECPIDKCGGPPAIVPPGYGIEFGVNSNNYFLFADLNDNGRYEELLDAKIETMDIEKGVIITELLTTASKNKVWVVFKPPDPLTIIRDPSHCSKVEIKLEAAGQNRKVFINQAGLIYVE